MIQQSSDSEARAGQSLAMGVMAGVAVAAVLAQTQGSCWGAAALVICLLSPLITWALLALMLRVWFACFPERPPCERGRCGGDDYEETGRAGGQVHYICRCGHAYVCVMSDGLTQQRFLRVGDDGRNHPYMTRPFASWKPDPARGRSGSTPYR